ncbi:DNA mismatch endonuclease Vsr [Sphingomonas daechungensis]|uniref:Very short patch repair endonuclease n=2 Tax=Sphingomonas daechungensis TaxID=1176646 RepID=A0ABX6T298_9SPHN|nr:DNA mismatch endonuclease Vsr [Sphingomonas daechungensis]
MRKIRSTDTKPEMRVRRLLHRMGFRFRLHRCDLPGKPDVVLPRYRLAILVHGCFWHQHPGCRHARLPRTRQNYWLPKLARTQERDLRNVVELNRLGWRTLTIWECSVDKLDKLEAILRRVTAAPQAASAEVI